MPGPAVLAPLIVSGDLISFLKAIITLHYTIVGGTLFPGEVLMVSMGYTGGPTTEESILAATDAAFDYVHSRLRLHEQVYIWGISLGVALAVHLAAKHQQKV